MQDAPSRVRPPGQSPTSRLLGHRRGDPWYRRRVGTHSVRDGSSSKLEAVRAVAVLGVAVAACGPKHARVDVRDAPANQTANALTLDGGRIALEAGGRYDRLCEGARGASSKGAGCIDHHFYVFPVVPTSAPATEPVPAWVTCSGNETSFEACASRVRAYTGEIAGSVAVRLGTTGAESGWEKAAKEAASRHGLAVAPRAPVLRLGRM